MAIARPGVEITQEFVTENPTVSAPSLAPVVFGPCYQIVDAFNDDGEAQADALGGTYQDGNGYVSYDLPGLKTGAVVDSDSIRAFLVLGSDSTELNAVGDEEDITSGTSGTYTWSSGSTAVFSASGTTWIDDGVEAGDVVRVTYQGDEYDLLISGTVADESLTVSVPFGENASIAFSTYEIVRNPAQFVYQSAVAQAAYVWGDETNYLEISTLATGDYAGQAGDGVTIKISETDALDSGTDGAHGAHLFISDTATHKTHVGSVGAVTGRYLLYDSATEATNAVLDVKYVLGDKTLIVDSGGITAGAGDSGKNWATLDAADSSHLDITASVEVSAAGVVTFAGVDFSAHAGSGTWYCELEGGTDPGVYLITNSTLGSGTFELTSGHAGSTPDSISVYRQLASGADGSSGAETQFASPSLLSSSFAADPSSYDIVITDSSDVQTGYTAASYDADELTVTLTDTTGASGEAVTWKITDTTANPNLTWDADSATVTIRLARANGVSTSTMASILAAITDDTDSYYDADVAAVITAAVNGTGNVTYADAGSVSLDGGADADSILVDSDLIGSTTPVGKVYTSYKALRLDVSDQADDPALLSFDNTTDLIASIGPLSADNPLCLGMYFALLNSANKSVKGIGVSATSTAQPEGTTTAYSSALSFLGGQNVYALAPLSQDPEVLAAVSSHCTAFSAADQKAERICFLNRAFPSYSSATLIASGTAGNTESDFLTPAGDNYCKFSTSHNFADNTDFTTASGTLVLVVSAASGADHAPTLAAGTSTLKYGLTVSGVDSSDDFVIEVEAADAVSAALLDEGDDWEGMVDVTWAVYEIGTALTTTAATASRVGDYGSIYSSRRSFLVWPPEGTAAVSGSDISVKGYYFAAAWAGKLGQATPSQGFTNTQVTGFSTLKYSNGYFSEAQLDSLAGGGTYIMVQETASSPILCRHQLSTDVTSIQKRELSITKSIDYVAKLFRGALESKIGKYNITQSFIDALSIQCQGMLRNLVQTGVLNEAQLTSIEVDDTNPDTVNIVLLLGVPYPCNYIALTLQI